MFRVRADLDLDDTAPVRMVEQGGVDGIADQVHRHLLHAHHPGQHESVALAADQAHIHPAFAPARLQHHQRRIDGGAQAHRLQADARLAREGLQGARDAAQPLHQPAHPRDRLHRLVRLTALDQRRRVVGV